MEFLTSENILPIKIHRRVLAFCDNETVDVSTVRRSIIRAKDSQIAKMSDLRDLKWSRRLKSNNCCEQRESTVCENRVKSR